MVTPDSTRYEQDITPGLIRQLHEALSTHALAYRNRSDVDYGELVKSPELIASSCDDGYVLGVPFGRHLRIYYEFDQVEPMRRQFTELLNEVAEIAIKNSAIELLVLEFNDFPRRHRQESIFIGAEFDAPINLALMRCRDVREQEIPEAPSDVSVREATVADIDAFGQIEENIGGDDRLAPPFPKRFFDDARWIAIAEVDGAPAGYIRVSDAEKRGLLADQFVVDGNLGSERVSSALLHAAILHGREDNRRALTVQVAQDAIGDPTLTTFGLKHAGDGLRYQRIADPAVVEENRLAKVETRVKVGRIWGRF